MGRLRCATGLGAFRRARDGDGRLQRRCLLSGGRPRAIRGDPVAGDPAWWRGVPTRRPGTAHPGAAWSCHRGRGHAGRRRPHRIFAACDLGHRGRQHRRLPGPRRGASVARRGADARARPGFRRTVYRARRGHRCSGRLVGQLLDLRGRRHRQPVAAAGGRRCAGPVCQLSVTQGPHLARPADGRGFGVGRSGGVRILDGHADGRRAG